MPKYNDDVEAVCREVRDAGLEPVVARLKNNHMRVSWRAGDKIRSCVTPGTPSDYRSALNSRADARRILRQDGYEKLPVTKKEPEGVVEKMFHVPEPSEPLVQRVGRLEDQLEALTDLFIEQALRIPEVAVDGRRYVPDEETRTPSKGARVVAPSIDNQEAVYRELELNLSKTPMEIAKAVSVTRRTVSNQLNKLAQDGRAVRIHRGAWRKTQ